MKINIHIEDYNYHLPEDRIAKYPLAERDASKLLVYKDKKVGERIFRDLPTLLPDKALMVFNDTKVVPARLHFCKESGAHIEIFCLEPLDPVEYNTAFASRERCVWKCVIGNAKRWKAGPVYLINPEKDARIAEMDLRAELLERDGQTGKVAFSWANGAPFSEVLECCGTVPIPPYLNRDTEELDKTRYQTLYAHIRGSVAAPTAGLHFTEAVLDAIRAKGIDTRNVCLHVGAGTFLPVKTSDVGEHPMHREPFVVEKSLLQEILKGGRPLIAVGTTSVRTLESLYYAGVGTLQPRIPLFHPGGTPGPGGLPGSHGTGFPETGNADYHRPGLPVAARGYPGDQFPSARKHADPAGFGLCGRRLEDHLPVCADARIPFPELRRQLCALPQHGRKGLIVWYILCIFVPCTL